MRQGWRVSGGVTLPSWKYLLSSCRNSLGSRKRHAHETNTNTVLSLSLSLSDVFAWINAAPRGVSWPRAKPSLRCNRTNLPSPLFLYRLPRLFCVHTSERAFMLGRTHTLACLTLPFHAPVCGNTKREVEIESISTPIHTRIHRLIFGYIRFARYNSVDQRIRCCNLSYIVSLLPA